MVQGTYPKMSMKEIISDFSEWGLPISIEQLRDPTSEFIEPLYRACLQHATGITYEALQEPAREICERSSFDDNMEKENFQSNLAHTMLIHHLTRFARAARIENFSSMDIAAPTSPRTISIISGFMNFIKFIEQECQPNVTMIKERSAHLIQERDQVLRELQEVETQFQELQLKMEQDRPKYDEIQRTNAELRAKIFATKNLQTNAVNEVENLKAERNDLLRRKETLQSEILTISDSIARTRKKIVQSPDRIKRTISTMRDSVIQDRQTVAAHEAKVRGIQAKINALLQVEKDLRACCDQLQTIGKEVRALEESVRESTELRDHLDKKKIEQHELTLRQERVHKQLSNAREKLAWAQRHAEEKRYASQQTIDRLQKEYDMMDIERKDNDKQVEELRKEAEGIQAKMTEHLKASEADLNALLAEYWKLRHETDIYMETLANKLNMRSRVVNK